MRLLPKLPASINHKGLFTPNDSVTVIVIIVTLTGGTFDLFHGHCKGQNGLHTHFACQPYICYSDGDRVA